MSEQQPAGWSETALEDLCFPYTGDGYAPAQPLFDELAAEGFTNVRSAPAAAPRSRYEVFEGHGWRISVLVERVDNLVEYAFERLD